MTPEQCVTAGGHHPGPVRHIGFLGMGFTFKEHRLTCTSCGAHRQGLLKLGEPGAELEWSEWYVWDYSPVIPGTS